MRLMTRRSVYLHEAQNTDKEKLNAVTPSQYVVSPPSKLAENATPFDVNEVRRDEFLHWYVVWSVFSFFSS